MLQRDLALLTDDGCLGLTLTWNLLTVTGRCWPMRQARPMACSSRAGFRAGSRMKTWLAEVRLMPTLPLRMDSRNTVVGGSFWNASIACSVTSLVGMVGVPNA